MILACLLAVLSSAVFALHASAGFITAPTYAAGSRPFSIASGDFNSDGIPDLVVGNYNSFGNGTVSILLGKGDGTFQAPQSFDVGFNPSSVAMGDFNSDGHLDLAVAGNDSRNSNGSVTILLGQGDGTFQAAQSYAEVVGASFVVVGDFNDDGIPDLAVAYTSYPSKVSVLLGKGDGSFQAAQSYAAGPNAVSAAVGDFNGDGHLDIAMANNDNPGKVSILLGNGDGTFQPVRTYVAAANLNQALSIAVGDFNGDGILDLAVAVFGIAYGAVNVLFGNGDGTFRASQSYAVGFRPSSMAVGDFNRDGHLDITVTDDLGATILLGNGDGTFQAPRNYAAGPSPGRVEVGDFNGDGIPDLAVANDGVYPDYQGTVCILLGKGDGTFQAAPSYGPGGSAVAVGDFNGDGIPDLAVADGQGTVRLGRGDGTFQPAQAYVAGSGPTSVAVGDFNGDGKLDIVTTNFSYNSFPRLGWYRIIESDLRVYLGNGDASFQVPHSYAAGVGPNSIAVGDFNGDGILDLATANYNLFTGESTASVLLGNGDGTFQTAQNYAVRTFPQSVAVGDFNGDGHPDLAVAGGRDLSILLGKGDGTFQAAQNYAVGVEASSVAVGDFNGDGILDLAMANHGTYPNYYDGSVTVLLGKGDGTFLAAQNYLAGRGPASVTVADFNRDGALDIAVINGLDGTVSILLGKGDGTFQTAQVHAAGKYLSWINVIYPNSLAVGDFNRDGYLDLVVANTVTVLINAADWGGGP